MKTLAQDTIISNARFFGGDRSQVPTQALTVGVGTVMDAKEVCVCLLGWSACQVMEEEYVVELVLSACTMECASASGAKRRSLTVIRTAVCVPWILCIHPTHPA